MTRNEMNMGNCYPQRNLKTGQAQRSLCESCINHLEIELIKTSVFWNDDAEESFKEVEQKTVLQHNQGCKYLNLGRDHYHDVECIVVTRCNQYLSNKDLENKELQKSVLVSIKNN